MNKIQVDSLIQAMLETGHRVSDLLFITGKAALVEVDGRLVPFAISDYTPITPQFIDALSELIVEGDERLLSDYTRTGSCDCSYVIEGVARFRVNIYKENNNRAIVMRKLQPDVPSLSALGLPSVFAKIVHEKNGIVLVTGATGSGKTTTLAALINELNQTDPIHIVTLEDPIEFLHVHAQAAISHRELGRDFYSFAQGLRSALRQAPKAILLGEIRDRETMEIALTAAETGHIVYSTLHTINAGQTINRILGLFTKDEEEQLRYRLSETVRYIVSQRLVPKIDGGRFLITEVLGNNLRTRESIRHGESEGRTFHEIMDAATLYGWHTFDHCLLHARETEQVTEETALLYCNDKGKMKRHLDLLNKRHGRTESDSPPALKLDISSLAKPPLPPELVHPSITDEGDAQSRNRRTIAPRMQPK
jgi:twitching motility protein PilT